VLNLCAMGLDCAGYWLVLRGFGWSLPVSAAVTVDVFLGAGASVPSAPGYLGIYQAACVLALRLYGIGETQALAYSIVVQVFTILIITVQSLAALASYRLSLSDLAATSPLASGR